ncbi:GTP-binding protein [Solemya velum gill symbiont]|nr:GTP-binding protein [Solemya velum gill symbiont]
MPLSHHPLVTEFPEYHEQLHKLKMSDSYFSSLMEKYEELDKQVYRMEDGSEPTSDEVVEQLKKERLALKDEIFHKLHEA